MGNPSGKFLFLTSNVIVSLFIALLAALVILGFDATGEGIDPEYHTYEEIMADYEAVAQAHPEITELINLSEEYGTPLTYGNHSLHALRITDKDSDPYMSEREPSILFTSIHHAREWITVEVTSYFMHYLVDNYGTDPYVTYLVDNRDIWIIPIVNPDGYLQSWEQYDRDQNWTGWRKNIRDNNNDGVIDGNDGVDLNRNYGFEWGYDESGSSGDQSSSTYRGPAPFSEPETQTVAALCNDIDFTMVIHYHSNGNLIFYPWAYEKLDTSDHETFVMLGEQMSRYNGYEHGNTRDGITYKCNGEACDWNYAAHGSYAFTIELGYDNDRYIPDESRIIPISEENLQVNLFVCNAVDDPGNLQGYADPDEGADSPGDQLWNHSGTGDNWELNPDSAVGSRSWYLEVGAGEDTQAELNFNVQVVGSDNGDQTVLAFWQQYHTESGTDLFVYLKNEQDELTLVTERLNILDLNTGGRGATHGQGKEEDEGDGEGEEADRRRGEDEGEEGDRTATSDGSSWDLVFYNLTPYLTQENQTISFMVESIPQNAGDYWYIDGIRITSSVPTELQDDSSKGEGPEEYNFTISPETVDLDLLPDGTYLTTVDITNEANDNNTIDLTGESDMGWNITFLMEDSEVDHVVVGPDRTLTVNISIEIPASIVAGELSNFTVSFQSRENNSQNATMEIQVTIDTFYHISLLNPGNIYLLPGEQKTIEMTIQNTGNSPIDINPQYDPTSGDDEEWELIFLDDPHAEPYSDTTLFLSVTAPSRIEVDEEISIKVEVGVIGHAIGDGKDSQEYFLIIDEEIDGGFASLESPTAEPGAENTYNIKLHNLGNVHTRFFFSVLSEWEVSLSKTQAEIGAYDYSIIVLTLTPPTDINAGETKSVELRINNPVQNSTTIIFTSTAFYKVGISASKQNHTIAVGREKDITLTVNNLGNTQNHVSISYSQLDGFEVSFSDISLTIPAFSTRTTDITINLSLTVPYDQDNNLEVTVQSDDDPAQMDSTSLRITSGKSYDVKLSIDSEGRKQTISPKESVDYIINVENRGNALARISFSYSNVPNKWIVGLDDSEVDVKSGKTQFIRLTITAPSDAKNKEEARIVITAEAGDSSFGYVTDEVTAIAIVTADESEGGISLVVIVGSFVLILVVIGGFLFITQRQRAEAGVGGAFGSSSEGDGYPAGSEGFSGIGGAAITAEKAPTQQNVSCPKCSSSFDVELPAGDKKTVKTMCIKCGEIFSFDRKEPEPEPEFTSQVKAPTQQNVSCPKCSSSFDVELPAGDKKTVKTMCIECGEIFSFDRKEPEPVPEREPKPQPEPEKSDLPREPEEKTPIESQPRTQHVHCPECSTHFDVELPEGDRKSVKTMCVECSAIFSFDRREPPADEMPPSPPKIMDRSKTPGVDTDELPKDEVATDEKNDTDRDREPPKDDITQGGRKSGEQAAKPAGDEGPSSRDLSPPTEPRTSQEIKTGAVKEVTEIKKEEQAVDTGSGVAVPKVMKCPKCGRKVFLKGKEEKVKCIFCGTRIQIERRKKGA